jgi:UDP-N-acetyl-D-mannosaminuronic acid dehydrogenase
MSNTVCVVGLGYIGLPTAAVLAANGWKVHGVEVNPNSIDTINSGKAHFPEPDLDMLVQAGVQTGRLRAHPEPTAAEIFVICVPTPLSPSKDPDMSYVEAATEAICPHVRAGALVILESTSPPGTTEWIAKKIGEETGLEPPEVMVVHAPERVLPGQILREVVENDRIVGGVDEASTEKGAEFYQSFARGQVFRTDARTAETTKLVENAFRDVNIAFANELSFVSEDLGLDVWDVIEMANRHPRVNILSPGPGVGGHCIPVDPWFLIAAASGQTPLMKTARDVNDRKPDWVVDRVVRHADRFRNPRIACLGLAYKPDVDDLRESPAVQVARALRERIQGEVLVVEPNLGLHPEFDLRELHEAIHAADIVVVLVAHKEFKKLSPAAFEEKIVVDTCGILRG